NGGTLQLGAAGGIPDTSSGTVASGAGFDLKDFSESIDAPTGSGRVPHNGAMTGKVTGGASKGSGALARRPGGRSGTLALTKSGSGTQTLSGNNTYSGPTTINGGTLSISRDSNLGNAPNNATPGQLVINGGTLQTTASFTLDIHRGIALGPASGSGGGTIDVVGDRTTLTYDGILADNGGGTGSLTKAGSGTLVLTNPANSYGGNTTIS